MANQQRTEATAQNSGEKVSSTINKFKYGFWTGLVIAVLATAGVGHLFLNVFKFGSVTIGDRSFGKIASPETVIDEQNVRTGDSSNVEQDNSEVNDSENVNQATDGGSIQIGSDNDPNSGDALSNGSITGDTVSVTINYSNNSELPGFDSSQGYTQQPPDVGQFNDAILITSVSLGNESVEFATKEIFINRKKYTSTFSLEPDRTLPTRVGFSLDLPGVTANATLLQFGLADLTSGSTTLTYLVNIYGDGEILWSNQVKYEEAQIISVVLDTQGTGDIVVEYQVVETAGINPIYLDDYPLFFTEAKVLEN
ncbi:MAG: hypothetical protein F6K00_07780 [Leptolyngbya sp. SIOISBB]|nr:hypothetical protein [Leptolyngbya sp. SIOISBB]